MKPIRTSINLPEESATRNALISIIGLGLAAGSSIGSAQAGDLVVGAGRFDSVNSKVEVMAMSGANGEDAEGRFVLRQEAGSVYMKGEVFCLAVNGADASIGGLIVESANANLIGATFFQIIRDNGQGRDDNDQSQTILSLNADPASCANYLGFDPAFTMDRGQYEVKDR